MQKHEIKTCPRCTHPFECKTGDILNCQCETVKLSQQQRDYIFQKHDDCLCANCLRILRSEFNIVEFNQQMHKLVVLK